MTRYILLVAAMVTGLLTGCVQQATGTRRPLGAVEYEPAFAKAQLVMAQYFSIASVRADEGIIKSRPEPVQVPAKGFLSGRPCRKLATLQLYMVGKQVVANVSVAVQRQGLSVRRQMQVADGNYDSVPNETPAQIEAATTPEQNEGWWTESYDKVLEHRILHDLYKALHGPAER